MKYSLDHLCECLDTFDPYADEEEKKILSIVTEKDEAFVKSMTAEQMKLYEDYQNVLSELNLVCQKNSFIKGIKFATQFFLEATEK